MNFGKGALLAWAFFLTLAYVFNLGGDAYFPLISWIITFISIGFALFFGYKAVKFFGTDAVQGKSALFFFLAILSWLCGNLYNAFFTSENSIGIADAFFLLGYFPLVASIFVEVKAIAPNVLESAKKNIFAIGASVVLIGAYLKFFPILWNADWTFLENVVLVGYVVSDLILLLSVITLVLATFSGALGKAWLVIAIGLGFTLSGDLLYNLNFDTYSFSKANFLDLFYYYGYLTYAYGFVVMREAFDFLAQTTKKTKTRRVR